MLFLSSPTLATLSPIKSAMCVCQTCLCGFTHVQGVRVTEVPLSVDSLNSGDVFLLDLGSKIVVWAGSAATGMEKNKALTYTIALRDDKDHKGTAEVIPFAR